MNKRIILLFILFPISKLNACECASLSIVEEFGASAIIFKGKVTEIIPNKFFMEQGSNTPIINFQITKNFKNTVLKAGTISLIQGQSSCDFIFELNKEYMVFAHHFCEGFYQTSICSKTSTIERFNSQDETELTELSENYLPENSRFSPRSVVARSQWEYLDKEVQELRKFNANYIRTIAYLISLILLLSFIAILFWKKHQKETKN